MVGEYQKYVSDAKKLLNVLPPGYRERALANFNNDGCVRRFFRDGMCIRKSRVINDTICWDKTPEGIGFWHSVHSHVETNGSRPLPPLPK